MVLPRFTSETRKASTQVVGEAQTIFDKIEPGLSLRIVLSSDATAVSSNTLTAQTGLSQDVLSGIVYSFTIILWITATAGEGLQINLAGGTAAMSWVKAAYEGYDGSSQALIGSSIALSTAISSQDAFSGWVKIHGSFQPSGDGTFVPKIAQTAHSSGSVQVLKGSSSLVQVTV